MELPYWLVPGNVKNNRMKVNFIGLTNFISTVIGANLTSCHVKLILVTPLGSKTRKLGAFSSYIPTYFSKTCLERNVFYISRRIYICETQNV